MGACSDEHSSIPASLGSAPRRNHDYEEKCPPMQVLSPAPGHLPI